MATKMTVGMWYGKSLKVPTYTSSDFHRFLISGVGLVRSILKEKLGKPISIRFLKTDTAFADQDKGLIAINGDFVNGMYPGRSRAVNSETTIGVIMGIIVHEAAHFAYSPPTLKPWADYIKKNSKLPLHEQAAMTLGNIIEDIYIEAEVNRTLPAISWMLDCTNDIFFSKELADEKIESALKIESAPTTLDQVGDALNLLILAKTRTSVKATPYMKGLFSEILGAADMVSLDDRLALAFNIYEELFRNIPLDEMQDACSGKGKGSGEGEGDAIAEALDEVAGLTSKRAEKGGHYLDTHDDYDVRMLDRDLEALEEDTLTYDRTGEDEEIYVERVVSDGPIPKMDERYERLAEIGRQRASVNRPYGQDRNRGTNIRKLYRIATDQKIFAERVLMSSYQPMQVLLLIDCSSSMMSYLHDYSQSLISAAVSATYGAAKGLLDARCDVAIYGHTGFTTTLDETMIYQVKSFTEPFFVAPTRLGHLANGARLSQNKDGRAIRYIAKKFSHNKSKRRLLIVLSDGEPASPDYHGSYALQDTKAAVREVRQMGIDVLSISIGSSATHPNNIIYGKDWNVSNESPEVLEEVVRSLLLK